MNRTLASAVCIYCLLFGSPLIAAGTPPVKLQVSPGQQQMVTLSRLHLNRIVTPFPAPQVRTIDQADIRIEGPVIYLSSRQEEPFVVYITPPDNESHALSLLVTLLDVPPKEIQLTLSKQWQRILLGNREAARKWEESADYEQTITDILKTLVKGQIPEGYELGKFTASTVQPCQQDGLVFDFTQAQQVQGHHFNVLVGTTRNHTEKPVTFHEQSCHGRYVSAVSMWPKNSLYPGQKRELFIVSQAEEPESAPPVRPSLLSY
ncbi:TraK domain-containing protein [Endozoicomonas lisbonensis]|uniref:Conjugal transfer pilus assembly protein TraK n=1 Tax=Endozoicomonas lisbonensis TaxID=3120522 RepID=A0ABV2SNP8_9GAMM